MNKRDAAAYLIAQLSARGVDLSYDDASGFSFVKPRADNAIISQIGMGRALDKLISLSEDRRVELIDALADAFR